MGFCHHVGPAGSQQTAQAWSAFDIVPPALQDSMPRLPPMPLGGPYDVQSFLQMQQDQGVTSADIDYPGDLSFRLANIE